MDELQYLSLKKNLSFADACDNVIYVCGAPRPYASSGTQERFPQFSGSALRQRCLLKPTFESTANKSFLSSRETTTFSLPPLFLVNPPPYPPPFIFTFHTFSLSASRSSFMVFCTVTQYLLPLNTGYSLQCPAVTLSHFTVSFPPGLHFRARSYCLPSLP